MKPVVLGQAILKSCVYIIWFSNVFAPHANSQCAFDKQEDKLLSEFNISQVRNFTRFCQCLNTRTENNCILDINCQLYSHLDRTRKIKLFTIQRRKDGTTDIIYHCSLSKINRVHSLKCNQVEETIDRKNITINASCNDPCLDCADVQTITTGVKTTGIQTTTNNNIRHTSSTPLSSTFSSESTTTQTTLTTAASTAYVNNTTNSSFNSRTNSSSTALIETTKPINTTVPWETIFTSHSSLWLSVVLVVVGLLVCLFLLFLFVKFRTFSFPRNSVKMKGKKIKPAHSDWNLDIYYLAIIKQTLIDDDIRNQGCDTLNGVI
ncbi:uncharacterized protein LOC131928728 isoform X2 [Physella acuta]|nr:uncharacterized protein LOC131928728 isoform X2 [Physella acuta]XP_059140805.1 uncharacterized protein LOC131928728 isoform X2 [Physella acuta]